MRLALCCVYRSSPLNGRIFHITNIQAPTMNETSICKRTTHLFTALHHSLIDKFDHSIQSHGYDLAQESLTNECSIAEFESEGIPKTSSTESASTKTRIQKQANGRKML